MHSTAKTASSNLIEAFRAFIELDYEQAKVLYLEVLYDSASHAADKRAARMGLGSIYLALEQFEQAEQEYLILLHDAFQRGDRHAERLALNHLGMVAWMMSDFDIALHYFDAEAIVIEQLLSRRFSAPDRKVAPLG